MAREFEIDKKVELPASPEQVWQAIATGPGQAAWFMPMPVDEHDSGTVTWDPPRRLTLRSESAKDGATQAFDYLIEATGGGATVLRFVHSGVLGADWSDEFEGMTSSGWDMYLFTLAQYLRHFPGRTASYVEAEAPEAANGWQNLLRRLAPARLGAQVRIELPDGTRLHGEVDYLTEQFVGLRTAEALIRFHERSAIGCPIAVSNHHYDELAEPQHAQAWRDWLAAAVREEQP